VRKGREKYGGVHSAETNGSEGETTDSSVCAYILYIILDITWFILPPRSAGTIADKCY